MNIDFKAKLKSWFKKDKVLLYIISLAVAIALWAAIIFYVDPDTTIVISDVPVQISTSSQDAVSLSIVSGKVETVNVEIKAPRSQVPSLTADSLTAEIDLTGETKSGTYEKTIDVSSNSEFVKIISVSPSTTTIVLDVTESKTFQIEVDDGGFAAPEGYYLASASLSTDTVKLTGPKGLIDTVKHVSVSVEIEEDSVGIIDFRDCPIKLLDADGNAIENEAIVSSIDKVTVSVPIIRRKTVPLKLEYANADNVNPDFFKVTYTIGNETFVKPEDIEIAAVDDVYDDITSISIGTLDFSKINTREHSEEFKLEMPNGVSNISGVTAIGVTITFNSLTTDSLMIMPDDISVLNSPTGKTATITSKSVRVAICGEAAAVNEAKTNGIAATVTLSATSAGIREYPVSISFGKLENIWYYVAEGASEPSVIIEIK